MIHDFYVYIFKKDKRKVEDKISEYRGSKARRSGWMEQNLPSVIQTNLISKSWYWLVKELTLFQKYYEAMNDDRRDDIKSGYKGLISISSLDVLAEKLITSSTMPLPYCIAIQITFKLEKPFVSRDDDEFYIIDNPICKERVFKVPCVRSTTWKGILRFTAYKMFVDELPLNKKDAFEKRAILIRLFGNEKDRIEKILDEIFDRTFTPDTPENTVSEEFFEYITRKNYVNKDGNRQGRLIFYPTLLNKIGLDVITPLDRVKRTPVRGPIFLETARGKEVDEKGKIIEGAKGKFLLLYLPFDLMEKLSSEKEEDKQEPFEEIKEDLKLLKETIPKMLLEYGFSAKKTSGYGVVEDEIEFWINSRHNKGSFDEFKKEMDEITRSLGDNNG